MRLYLRENSLENGIVCEKAFMLKIKLYRTAIDVMILLFINYKIRENF